MPLSPQWRRALEILADAGLSGITDAELMDQGFSAEMMASLVLSGRTVATGEGENGAGRPIKIVRMRITDAGRKELDVCRPKRAEYGGNRTSRRPFQLTSRSCRRGDCR